MIQNVATTVIIHLLGTEGIDMGLWLSISDESADLYNGITFATFLSLINVQDRDSN